MTIAWTTDESDNSVFTHEGWTVRIWAGDMGCPPRIEVNSPQSGEEVRVDEWGIEVNGEESGGWYRHPRAFTIPWAVAVAIIEARGIVMGTF